MRDSVDDILDQWARERPDLDASPIGVIGRTSRLARALEARLEPVYRAHGLEPGWHDLLATLRRQGPPFKLRPTDLTGSVMLDVERDDQAAGQARGRGPDHARAGPERPPRHAHRAHGAGP